MDDDDDDRERDARLKEALDRGVEELRALADGLADLNSLFPATREFLARCGATHVKELTPEQMLELQAYLRAEHDALVGTKKPSN